MNTLKTFLAVLVIGPVLDFVWFGLFAQEMYKKEVGVILRMKDGAVKPELIPAVIVYLLISTLVVFFVLPRIGLSGSTIQTFLWGALAGLIVYGIYDFTNISFLKDWTWTATVLDVLWGTFMVGAVSVIARYISTL